MSSLPKEAVGVAEQIFEKPKKTSVSETLRTVCIKIREHFYNPRKDVVSDVPFWPKRQELHPFLGFSLNEICGQN